MFPRGCEDTVVRRQLLCKGGGYFWSQVCSQVQVWFPKPCNSGEHIMNRSRTEKNTHGYMCRLSSPETPCLCFQN